MWRAVQCLSGAVQRVDVAHIGGRLAAVGGLHEQIPWEFCLFLPPVHDLINSLIRNTKLARQFSLRNARSMSGTDNDVSFAVAEGGIRRLRQRVEFGEQVVYGGIDQLQGRTVLGPNSPLFPCLQLETADLLLSRQHRDWLPCTSVQN